MKINRDAILDLTYKTMGLGAIRRDGEKGILGATHEL